MSQKHILIGLLAALSACAQAQVLNARSSTLKYTFVDGFAGGTVSDGFESNSTAVDPEDFQTHTFNHDNSGTWQGNPWTAGIGVSMNHTYALTGGTSGFSRIVASGSTSVSAYQTGVAGSQILASAPGNQLILEFQVDQDTDYVLTGNLDVSDGEESAFSLVALQQWNGLTWTQVYTTVFLPDLYGAISDSGTLAAGQYRMLSALSLTANGNEAHSANYNYDLQVVPEPITLTLAAPLLFALARKRKKKA